MRIYSIFLSVDGECNKYGAGTFSTFIRFAGCAMAGNYEKHCGYCDTKYAQAKDSGMEMGVSDVMREVRALGCSKVTITGGDPLCQFKALNSLLDALVKESYRITLETNGSYSVRHLCGVDSVIMDYKLSNSGVTEFMDDLFFTELKENDFVKMVVGKSGDYYEAIDVMLRLKEGGCKARFAFSPVQGVLNPSLLVDWLKTDQLFDVMVNLQIHKYIWPNVKIGEEV